MHTTAFCRICGRIIFNKTRVINVIEGVEMQNCKSFTLYIILFVLLHGEQKVPIFLNDNFNLN